MAELVSDDNVSNDKQNMDSSPLEKAQACVDELYGFRDRFYVTHGLEKSEVKGALVQQRLTEALDTLQQLSASIKDKSSYHFLRGKALNVTATFDPQALESLSKSVKLNPKLVDAWNQLGECYWKKGDLENAKNCFSGALNHRKNKESLRSLSMVMRQLATDQPDRTQIISESLDKAKEAIEIDMNDATSWFILGNAYMSMFFAEGQHTTNLDRCFQAYTRAEKDPIAMGNPDLHQNKAVASQYNEDYQAALEGYNRAATLDPGWTEPRTKESQIMEYLEQLAHLIKTKGKMSGKKVQASSQSICESDLGIYSGGSYTSHNGSTVTLGKTLFSNLKPGVNTECVIVGKVVAVANTTAPIPSTFLLVDEKCDCFPVTLYNLSSKQCVKISDTVAIPEPYQQTVNVSHQNKEYSFSSVRVSTPRVLVVNKKKLGKDVVQSNTLEINAVSQ